MNGGYAEFVAVEADNVVPVPDDVTLDAAAIAACAIGTMLHAVRAVGRIAPAETVLVTGAGGGLGMHGVQLAKRAGGRVIAQTTSPEKAATAASRLGADAVVMADRGGDFSAEVKALTDGEGVDCVLDTVGTPVFTPARRSLARGGRWVLVGQAERRFRAVQSGAAVSQGHLDAQRHQHHAGGTAAQPAIAAARRDPSRARPVLRADAGGRGVGTGAIRRGGGPRAAGAGRLMNVAPE